MQSLPRLVSSRISALSPVVANRLLHSTSMAPVKAGDAVPSVDLFEGAPDKKVNLAELTGSGKFVVFGVPGAFTPGCSKTHLPGMRNRLRTFTLINRCSNAEQRN